MEMSIQRRKESVNASVSREPPLTLASYESQSLRVAKSQRGRSHVRL